MKVNILGTKYNFNPHFRKGSDRIEETDSQGEDNFNPHFRKGSDGPNKIKLIATDISIHTSAREVTLADSGMEELIEISIHTSAREVTLHFAL